MKRFSKTLCVLLFAFVPVAWAQSSANGPSSDAYAAEVIRAMQQRGGQTATPLEPSVQVENPPVYRAPELPVSNHTAGQGQSASSALERLMSQRAGQQVRQFGYDIFGQTGTVLVRQSGAIQDNYILGAGDEIAVALRGQENSSYRTRVDRDGRLVLPGLPPVAAAGRSFGAFRTDLEAAVTHAFAGTEATVSVGAVRQITVRVVGEVNGPGSYSLSGLSTAMDALSLAGGVRKTGSLRSVEIVRGSRTLRIDLYALLTGGSSGADVTLTDGDRIVVPLYGKSVALVGQVKRPAIYELSPHQETIGTRALVALAGGPEIRGHYRFSILRTRDDGRREMVQTNPDSNAQVHDGDVVFVAATADVSLARVKLMGASRLDGYYPWQPGGTMRDLLRSPDMFAPTAGASLPYLLIGAIVRLDPQTVQRTVVPFSPVDVMSGKGNVPLQSNDVVYILNVAEMNYIAERAAEQDEQAPRLDASAHPDRSLESNSPQHLPPSTIAALQTAPSVGVSAASTAGAMADRQLSERMVADRTQTDSRDLPALSPDTAGQGNATSEDAMLNPGIAASDHRTRTAEPLNGNSKPAERDTQSPEEKARLFVGLEDHARRLLVRTLGNYRVTVTGEVNDPGIFLAMPDATLDHLVNAAGGTTLKADLKAFEVTSTGPDTASGSLHTTHKVYDGTRTPLSQIALRPMDHVRFNAVFMDRDSGDVSVYGQVRYPGAYEITRGEHLSTVLARAGGMTDAAYPAGAIFMRKSVAEQQRGVLQREGDALESELVALLASGTRQTPVTESEIQYINRMVEKLRDSSGQGGRVAVQIEPREIAAHPELDITLEPGDQLFVPRKPSSVIVAGEVMSPGGIQYRADLSVSDYVAMAGGTTELANDDHIFVIRPDGSAVQAESGWALPFDSTRLAPGSVIVVPRSLRHFTWDTLVENIVQVTSQLAVTAASISVIFR